jgi:F-type H+-transporting ATPase subunit a
VLWNLPQIGVPADTLFYIGPIPITNTLIMTWATILVILGIFFVAIRNPQIVPRGLQNLVEWAFQLVLNLCEEVAGQENGRQFFPWVATIFFFVLIANWWEVIPGIESIGTVSSTVHNAPHLGPIYFLTGANSNQITPWLRPPSTDLNFTLALAVTSVVVTQIFGFRQLGAFRHIGKYLNFREGPIGLVVGLLEAVLELARIISFSFRLFGNLFAGDVLLLIMAFLIPFAGATLFYFLEVFVGFIQAFVFAMLTLVFMTLAVAPPEHGEQSERQEEHARPGQGTRPATIETPTVA